MSNKPEMLKIRRYSHNLKIVMNVFYWVSIIVGCGALIAAVVIKLIPDSFFKLSEKSMKHIGFSLDGVIRYNLDDIALLGVSLKKLLHNNNDNVNSNIYFVGSCVKTISSYISKRREEQSLCSREFKENIKFRIDINNKFFSASCI